MLLFMSLGVVLEYNKDFLVIFGSVLVAEWPPFLGNSCSLD